MAARRLIIAFLLCLLAPGALLAQGYAGFPGVPAGLQLVEERSYLFTDEPEKKDPFVAGLLSWSCSGLGHFYAQEYTWGSFFLVTDIAQKGLFVYLLFYYSDKYSDKGGIVKWQDMERKDRAVIIGFVFSVLLVKVVSIVSAVQLTEKYNREIFFPYWKNKNRVGFSLDAEGDRLTFAVTKSFSFRF